MGGYLARALSRGFRTPPYIILFVTDRCWNRCRHCWYDEEWKRRNLSGPPLSLDEIGRLAGSIRRINFLSLTGGEAFSRDDIVEMTEIFAGRTKLSRYEIPTSGYEPGRVVPLASRMLERNGRIPFRVDVSIDGPEEIHDRIRSTPGSFRRALETLRGLRSLKKRYGHFDVGVITTISSFNQDHMEATGRIIESENPDGEWMINAARGRTREPGASSVDPEMYRKGHRLIEERIRNGTFAGHRGHRGASWLSAKNIVRRREIARILDGMPGSRRCAAGSLAGVIHADGKVTACEMFHDPMGDLREAGFDLGAVWGSEKAGAVRRSIAESGCACTHECFLSTSLIIQPRFWPEIAAERGRLFVSSLRGKKAGR